MTLEKRLLQAPTLPSGRLEGVAARSINQQRRAAAVSDFVEGSLPTPKVQAILGLSSPQAVHRLRCRGRIIGSAIGDQTWFPEWQFDADRIRPDLAGILDAARRFSTDAVAIDRIMRLERDELDGRSISDALRRPDGAETAWLLLNAIGV